MLHAQQEHFEVCVCEAGNGQPQQQKQRREIQGENKHKELTVSVFEDDFIVLKQQL